MDNVTINAMISKERLEEIISIEKERVLKELSTKDSAWCDYYTSWGAIHSGMSILKEEDIDFELNECTRERGFVCFKSTPDAPAIIQAAALVHFGVKMSKPDL